MVYRLVTANTIDQRIVERASSKRRLEKMIIHKGGRGVLLGSYMCLHLTTYTVSVCYLGKFKGYSGEDQQLSVDDLVDLLQSVDHDRVVNSKDTVISDDALRALLDRSSSVMVAAEMAEEDGGKRKDLGAPDGHETLFRVIEERDSSGKVITGLRSPPLIVTQS